jgi:2,4-dienoyl-CoA reductase-like NADH-dependent reductase (Old Yellow Enzyme family)
MPDAAVDARSDLLSGRSTSRNSLTEQSMSSLLFSPLDIGGMQVPNRIAVAPMCMYSADDGCPNDWHLQHWMMLGMSGAGTVTFEAAGVERRGRITHGCLGLYSDANEAAIARCLAAARRVAPPETKFGIQLAHAGRKASCKLHWDGGGPVADDDDPWPTIAPSAIAQTEGWRVPEALDEAGIDRLVGAFASAAARVARLGFDFAELHFAHGYLVHEFLSPISNKRQDQWGGSLENRMRFALAVARAVRGKLPSSMPLGARLSATDWVDGGFNPDEAVAVARALKAGGFAFICASSGGVDQNARVPQGPSFQVPFAERIRREAGVLSRAVGLIDDPFVAEDILAEGKADIVALARAFLADPRWVWRAAAALGHQYEAVKQYRRSSALIAQWAPRRAMARETA